MKNDTWNKYSYKYQVQTVYWGILYPVDKLLYNVLSS